MIYDSTKLIADAFDDNNIAYDIVEHDNSSVVEARFGANNGPLLIAKFVSVDDDNTISIRVSSLVTHVSKEKSSIIQEICNELNRDWSFFKAYLDEDGDVDIEYDLFPGFPDEKLGDTAIDLLNYLIKVLEEYYPKFIIARHDELCNQKPKSIELLKYLRDIQSQGTITLEGSSMQNRND